ncbi:flavin reductase [Amycolatopsis sp. RM579]|uniref:Flavin reductase n=2 Tax=Amycolatopsis pithecellobii TaxID=664692 RepID=A0A6N7Z717_9PSEU|nr:flavin reductase [Amycolatopsis pithecellobii]
MASTPAPVTIVTTVSDAGPAGATVSAFMSISLEPTLVAVSLRSGSRLLDRIEGNGSYGVNLLAEAQSELALAFARPGPDRFDGVPWLLDHGLPRLEESSAWLACELDSAVEAGDHKILVGRVRSGISGARPPLVYSHRLFGTNSSMRLREYTSIEARTAALARIAI